MGEAMNVKSPDQPMRLERVVGELRDSGRGLSSVVDEFVGERPNPEEGPLPGGNSVEERLRRVEYQLGGLLEELRSNIQALAGMKASLHAQDPGARAAPSTPREAAALYEQARRTKPAGMSDPFSEVGHR